jgi:hypothetical protein
MGWRIGYSCRLSTTGSPTTPVRIWMLLLEVHFYHSQSHKPQVLWRRWLSIVVGMKNVLRPAREVEVCISSRR